jgi:hypothetical protein
MDESGWVVPFAWIDGRITSFRWQERAVKDGIETRRSWTGNGYIYTIQEGHQKGARITVEKGVIVGYEQP